MAVEVAELIAHFRADTTKYIRDVEKAGAVTTKTGAQAEAGSMKFKKIQTASKLAAVAGVAILAVGLTKATEAAIKGQQSQARLEAAYKASGLSAKAYTSQNDELEASSRKLGFSNLDVRDSMGSLIIATHNQGKAARDLSVAEDVARFKHIGLSDATKVLTTAMAGSQRGAHMLGITVATVTQREDEVKAAFKNHTSEAYKLAEANAKVIDKQKQANDVIKAVTEKVHGQASAFAGTAAGGMAQFHAQTEQIEEVIGNMLIPVMTKLSGIVASASGFLATHAGVAKLLVGVFIALVAVLGTVAAVTKIWAGVQYIASAATTLWTAATEGLDAAMEANPIGAVVLLILGLVAVTILIVKHFGLFKAGIEAAWKAIKSGTQEFINFFTQAVPQAFDHVYHAIVGALTDAKNWVKGHWPEIATILSGPFAPIVALATGAFGIRQKIEDGLKDAKNWVRNHWPEIATIISGPFAPIVALATGAFGIRAKLVNAFQGIIKAVKGMAGAVGDAAASFGSAIYHGILGALSGLGSALYNAIIGPLKSILNKAKGITSHIPGAGAVSSALGHIGLATGGIVTRPTLAMIGEGGEAEAVVPLSKAGAMGFGGGGDTYYFTFPNYVGSKREIVDMVRSELLVQKRRRTQLGLT